MWFDWLAGKEPRGHRLNHPPVSGGGGPGCDGIPQPVAHLARAPSPRDERRDMAHHTDYFVEADDKIKFFPVGSRVTMSIAVGNYLDGVTLYFAPDSFAQLLALADQAEKAWSATLEDAS